MMNKDDFEVDLKAMMKGAKGPVTDDCCIYRVPSDIRGVNEDAYTPKVVSIGPFHHNAHPGLNNMETLKLAYLDSFLQQTETNIHSWIGCIEDNEPKFRDCYSEPLKFTKEQLTKIIFVDSAFIFYLFLSSGTMELVADDWLLTKPCLLNPVIKDMLLLENQLPFFILDHLFNLSFPSGSPGVPSLLELAVRYFKTFNISQLKVNDIVSIKHFTDLIRTFRLQHPMQNRPPRKSEIVTYLPSATELSEAGVIFKVKTQSTSFLDLKFSGRTFEIPNLVVEDETEHLFRNILALEQCHYPDESYITDYFDVLDYLVNTGKDVDILVHKGVLDNCIGDTVSVANFFNGMMKNITTTNFNDDYAKICRHLNAFYKNPWNKMKSTLRRDYCSGPWQTAATIAAIVLLFMTLLQTVCSVLPVIQQH